jgi:PAS domain S-box-containing protein
MIWEKVYQSVRCWESSNLPDKLVHSLIYPHSQIGLRPKDSSIKATKSKMARIARRYFNFMLSWYHDACICYNRLYMKNKFPFEESVDVFRTLIEQSGDAIQLINPQGEILYSSDSVFKVLGYTPEELQGQVAAPYIHPDDLPYFMEKVKGLLETPKKQVTMEYRVKHKNGSWVWLETTGTNHLDTPSIRALVGNFRDVTKRKELERQKDDFVAVATHELKTPVTSIKAYTQILQSRFKKAGDERSSEMLAKMDAQLDKLINLIGDLLDVSKLESGKMTFNLENFDFNELVKELVEELQRTTIRHEISIEGKVKNKVYGDRDRVGQVLTNLISNAIKYSPHAQEINVKVDQDEENVTLCVQDFGVGIAKNKQDKVFERFYRVSGPKEDTFPGLGLGLYISSEIIKRLGGRIWVESAKGKGATFCFSLPLKPGRIKQEVNILVEEEIRHE